MSADIELLLPPNDPIAFESLCLDFWKEIWNDPGAQKNGRTGQPQAGVDVFGRQGGKQIGVQCKQKDGLLRPELTVGELEDEVEKAKNFQPPLSTFIVATTASRNARVQERARLLTEEHRGKGLFSVEVWSWEDIWHELYQRKELLNRVGSIYWPHLHGRPASRASTPIKIIIVSVVLVTLAAVVVVLVKSHRSEPVPSASATIPAASNVASLPVIRIETLAGLPEGMTNDPNLRLNRLVVRNFNDFRIESFCSRLQLPEGIAYTIETNLTAGVSISWKPLLDKLSIAGTGGRTDGGIWIGPTSAVHFVETTPCFFYLGEPRGQLGSISKAGDFTGVWELTVDRLPPRGMVDILFLTSISTHGANYAEFAGKPLWASPPNPRSGPDTNELRFFFEGGYRYQLDGKLTKQNFFVPVEFDTSQRKISSLLTQGDIGHWHPVSLVFQ